MLRHRLLCAKCRWRLSLTLVQYYQFRSQRRLLNGKSVVHQSLNADSRQCLYTILKPKSSLSLTSCLNLSDRHPSSSQSRPFVVKCLALTSRNLSLRLNLSGTTRIGRGIKNQLDRSDVRLAQIMAHLLDLPDLHVLVMLRIDARRDLPASALPKLISVTGFVSAAIRLFQLLHLSLPFSRRQSLEAKLRDLTLIGRLSSRLRLRRDVAGRL